MTGPYCKETEKKIQFQRWKQKTHFRENRLHDHLYGAMKGNIMSTKATAFTSPKWCWYHGTTQVFLRWNKTKQKLKVSEL